MPGSVSDPCVSGNVRVTLLRFLFGSTRGVHGGYDAPHEASERDPRLHRLPSSTAEGYAPSFEEIAEAFGYSSLATVHEHLSNLERKGYIRKAYNESRSVELTRPGCRCPVGRAAAPTARSRRAFRSRPSRTSETLAVPPDMVSRRRDNYVLRVEGNSMIEEQIRDGDYIVVQAQENAEDGQMVVALVERGGRDGEEALPRAGWAGTAAARQPHHGSDLRGAPRT